MKLRLGDTKKIPRNLRKCTFCDLDTVEDEIHFFFVCTKNQHLREKLIQTVTAEIPNFNLLNHEEKLKVLLNPINIHQVQCLGSFLKHSVKLRTGDS